MYAIINKNQYLLQKLIYIYLFAFFFIFFQELRKWNIKLDNGMRNVSLAVYARHRLVLNLLFLENRKSTVQDVTRKNMLPGVLSVIW